jgi:multidrug efflux pump subunit AcrB
LTHCAINHCVKYDPKAALPIASGAILASRCALLLLMVAHYDLSVIAIVGIVKKNGIMLVDFALHGPVTRGRDLPGLASGRS